MNIDKIYELEGEFFARFPEGFSDPEMLKVRKKHNVDKLVEQANELFDPAQFGNPEMITQGMTKLVSRSSMVSMFDKPKFRDAVGSSAPQTRKRWLMVYQSGYMVISKRVSIRYWMSW